MKDEASTIVLLDLSKELTPGELASFRAQAAAYGRTLEQHLRYLVFGERGSTEKGAA